MLATEQKTTRWSMDCPGCGKRVEVVESRDMPGEWRFVKHHGGDRGYYNQVSCDNGGKRAEGMFKPFTVGDDWRQED